MFFMNATVQRPSFTRVKLEGHQPSKYKVSNLQNFILESQKAYAIQHPYGSLTETQQLKETPSGRTPDTAKHKSQGNWKHHNMLTFFMTNLFPIYNQPSTISSRL